MNVARLAKQAGFDAVDVKSCHRYLLSELLGAREREDKFGGSYENRTRLIKEVVTKIKREVGIEVAIRLNISDFLEYPIGWGVNEKGEVDLSEPLKLVGELRYMGVILIIVTAQESISMLILADRQMERQENILLNIPSGWRD